MNTMCRLPKVRVRKAIAELACLPIGLGQLDLGQREDSDGDGLPEIIHYNSRFAYQFSSFAGSGLPIQIWQYRQGQMVDVTRDYPQQVHSNAYKWWQIYTEARNGPDTGRGILAAYLADKYLLGEVKDGWNRVEQAYQESDRQVSAGIGLCHEVEI